MNFRELNETEFEQLSKQSPLFTFHQTPAWARLKESVCWKHFYVGIFDEDTCKGTALLLAKEIPYIKKYIFYSPRGILTDYHDFETLKYFTEELKKFVKAHDGIFLKIDPYIPYKQRDKEGNLIEGGYDNSDVHESLTKLGYRHKGFNIYFENVQPRWTSVLDLKDKSYEEIEKGYMATLRKELRQNLRNGIYTREMAKEELPEFIRLANATGERKGYNTRPLSYYEKMWDELVPKGYMKMAITFINFDKAIEVTQGMIDEILNARKENEEKAKAGKLNINPKRLEVKTREEDTAIANYRKNIENFNEMKKEYPKEIAVSSLLWLCSDREMICLSIGNDEKFMKYKTSFSCYNWGIQYALEHHKERYNFYGITGNFSKDNPDYGLFEMKQRFGAVVEELLGEYDLVISPLWHAFYQFYMKVRKH